MKRYQNISLFLVAFVLATLFFEQEATFGVNALGKKKKNTGVAKSDSFKDKELQIEKLGQQKLKEMEQMEARSVDNVIVFNPSDYLKYVVQNPRPYDVVMIFNVQANCPHCEIV